MGFGHTLIIRGIVGDDARLVNRSARLAEAERAPDKIPNIGVAEPDMAFLKKGSSPAGAAAPRPVVIYACSAFAVRVCRYGLKKVRLQAGELDQELVKGIPHESK